MTDQPDSVVQAPAPDSKSDRRSFLVLAASALFVLVAAAIALARNSGTPFLDILYAEDGTRFYRGAAVDDLSIFVEPYAGYMHLVPRLAGEVMAVVPIDWVGAASSLIPTLVVGILAVFVFFTSRVLLDSWVSRALLVTAMVVPPLAGQTIGNVSNLHWYLMFAAFWALISDPENRWWAVGGAAVGVAAAVTDPLTALLLPSAALAVYRYRSRLHGLVVAAVVLGVGAQLLIALGAEQRVGTESSWFDLPALYAFRVAGGLTVGDVHLASAWQRAGWSVPVTAIVAVSALVVLAILWSNGWRRGIVIASVVNSMLFLAVPLYLRGTTAMVPIVGEPPPLFSGRYTLVPALFLVVCVAVLLDLAVVRRNGKYVLVGGVAAGWLVISIVANFFITPLPSGPSWGEGIETAREECLAGPGDNAMVSIAPPGWEIPIPCVDL